MMTDGEQQQHAFPLICLSSCFFRCCAGALTLEEALIDGNDLNAMQRCRLLATEYVDSLQPDVVKAHLSLIKLRLLEQQQQQEGQHDAIMRLNNIISTRLPNWQPLLSAAAAAAALQGVSALGAPAGALLLRAEVIATAARDAEATARQRTRDRLVVCLENAVPAADGGAGRAAAFPRTACLAAVTCVNRWLSLREIANEAHAAAQAAEEALAAEARRRAEDVAAQLAAA